MSPVLTTALLLIFLAVAAYYQGRATLLRKRQKSVSPPHSLAPFHGFYLAFWTVAPACLLICGWMLAETHVLTPLVMKQLEVQQMPLPPNGGFFFNEVMALAQKQTLLDAIQDPAQRLAVAQYGQYKLFSRTALIGLSALLILAGLLLGHRKIAVRFPARDRVESYVRYLLAGCSLISVLITIVIVLSVLFEALHFFKLIPVNDFLFGLQWSPQTAMRADQGGSSGSFGAVPLFVGTMLITLIAMLVAIPVGLFSAVYMAEYASRRSRNFAKPILEILAGIPTVVYGYFAIIMVAPGLRALGANLGLNVASESALAAGLVMGVMIIPFISSLSDDIITAVPNSLREASYGLGATQSETIKKVILPAALPGIMGAVLLGFSRAIGETMIVVMAAGLAANLTANPLQAVTTVTAQIVSLLVGDQEFDSAKTLAAFALGLTLFVITLTLNIIALVIVKRYREKYD